MGDASLPSLLHRLCMPEFHSMRALCRARTLFRTTKRYYSNYKPLHKCFMKTGKVITYLVGLYRRIQYLFMLYNVNIGKCEQIVILRRLRRLTNI